MWKQDMVQNSFIQDAINCEAIKSWTNVHHQNCFSSIGVTPKTTQTFF